jgi:hypothetical protein
MSQNSAAYARSYQRAISTTPTVLTAPSDIRPVEVWLSSSADILVRGAAGDADITLPTGSIHKLPCNTVGNIRLTNTATVQVLVWGNQIAG